jgi:hypothetical protein
MRYRIAALALAAGLGLATLPAHADAPKQAPTKAQIEEAQRHYQRGRELYDDNDFAGALVEIRRAYDTAPSYKLLYDIGQICAQMQDYACALRTFTRYLDEGKGEIPAQRRDDVQADIERLKGRVATLRITTTKPGAEILVDDVSVGTTPLPEGVMVSAGRRKITAKLQGAEPVTKVVEVAGQDNLDVALDLAAPAGDGKKSEAPPATQPESGRKGGVPVVPWVITGVLAVGAGVTGGLAMGASSNLKTKLDTFGSTRPDIDDARSKTKTLALTTDVLFGVTAAMAVTSVILTVTSGSKSASEKKAAALPVRAGVAPGAFVLSGSF